MLSVLAGDAELKIARNQPIDVHGYVAICNCQRRALSVLGGFERDPKVIDGHANDGPGTVWPQYRADEAARSVRDADSMAKLIAQLDDSEPAKDDEPPAQQDSQP
jgi:hypothetical protein